LVYCRVIYTEYFQENTALDSATLFSHPAKQMTNRQKKTVALQAINKKASVTEVAKQRGVSRKIVNLHLKLTQYLH